MIITFLFIGMTNPVGVRKILKEVGVHNNEVNKNQNIDAQVIKN